MATSSVGALSSDPPVRSVTILWNRAMTQKAVEVYSGNFRLRLKVAGAVMYHVGPDGSVANVLVEVEHKSGEGNKVGGSVSYTEVKAEIANESQCTMSSWKSQCV